MQKRKIKRDRKRQNCLCLVRNGVGRMNSGGTQRQAVVRETKEILKDCHGNRCFGNRVLKAYRESALERERERRRCDREGWKRGGRSDSGEEEDGPKETTLTFGCHIRPRDLNRSHGSNFLGLDVRIRRETTIEIRSTYYSITKPSDFVEGYQIGYS